MGWWMPRATSKQVHFINRIARNRRAGSFPQIRRGVEAYDEDYDTALEGTDLWAPLYSRRRMPAERADRLALDRGQCPRCRRGVCSRVSERRPQPPCLPSAGARPAPIRRIDSSGIWRRGCGGARPHGARRCPRLDRSPPRTLQADLFIPVAHCHSDTFHVGQIEYAAVHDHVPRSLQRSEYGVDPILTAHIRLKMLVILADDLW